MSILDHFMSLVILGVLFFFLIYIHKINKSYHKRVIGDLSDEVKEQLIHAERQKVTNREKTILWHQTDSDKHFRELSVAFLIITVLVWFQTMLLGANAIIFCLLLFAGFETASFLLAFKNERHLFPWCRNYKTKGYVSHAFVHSSGASYTIAYYHCKKRKIVLQDISIDLSNSKDRLSLEGEVIDIVIHKRGKYEKVVAVPLE